MGDDVCGDRGKEGALRISTSLHLTLYTREHLPCTILYVPARAVFSVKDALRNTDLPLVLK